MPDSDERIAVIVRTLRDEVTGLIDELTVTTDVGRRELLARRVQALGSAANALELVVPGAK